MNIFFSDLDNTLIYSHRKMLPEGKVPVEQLNGKDQSFMTADTFPFFRDLDWINFVPVTTRSESQYQRLVLPENPVYAIICNGGKLLVHGREDREWSEMIMKKVRDDISELQEMAGQLREMSRNEVRAPEPYFYYTGTEDPGYVCENLRSQNPESRIRIAHDHRKVYLFPPNVNKGWAVRQLISRLQPTVTVSAGDSEMDVPMLNETDYALAAERISAFVYGPEVRALRGDVISDQICEGLAEMRRNGLL